MGSSIHGSDTEHRRSRDKGELARALAALTKNPLSITAVMLLGVMALVAVFAPALATHPPNQVVLQDRLLPPSRVHLFGTDDLGRDMFSRVLYGARISLRIALVVVGTAVALGTALGAVAGYSGGWVDELIMRCSEIFLAFPPLILAMAIAASLGASIANVMLALTIVWWPQYCRIIRGSVLVLRETDFVTAARALGASNGRIILRHILPNCFAPALVQGSLDLGRVLLTAATLSFLGFGARPPAPEWGAMISLGRSFIRDHWWYATFPGLAMLVTVLAFNLFGDAVRDMLDPRLRHR